MTFEITPLHRDVLEAIGLNGASRAALGGMAGRASSTTSDITR